MLWSDKFTFPVNSSEIGKISYRPGCEQLDPHIKAGNTKIPDKIMVWGCFIYHGVGKLIVTPKNETVNK